MFPHLANYGSNPEGMAHKFQFLVSRLPPVRDNNFGVQTRIRRSAHPVKLGYYLHG